MDQYSSSSDRCGWDLSTFEGVGHWIGGRHPQSPPCCGYMASGRRNRAGKTSSKAYVFDPRCRLLQSFDVCFAVKTRSRLRCHVAKNGKNFPRLPSRMMSVSDASKASHLGSWLYWKFVMLWHRAEQTVLQPRLRVPFD